MRRMVVTLTLVSGALLLDGAVALACGDKFLVIGRGRTGYRAAHPASILIYTRPDSRVAAAARELKLQSSLKRAGHRPETIEEATGFHEALKTGRYDVVLVDVADAEVVEEEARAAASRTVVVPVFYKPTPAELGAAERQYAFLVKAPSRGPSFLAVIDSVMELKLGVKAAKNR